VRKGVTAERQEAEVTYALVYLRTWIATERFSTHDLRTRIRRLPPEEAVQRSPFNESFRRVMCFCDDCLTLRDFIPRFQQGLQ